MTGIGALVITRNEAAHIVPCLRSLAFCDERVVVDSFSEDDTVRRALPHAEHVYRRTFLTHAEQKNWGLQQLRTPWALIVDADERVPPDLADELVRLAREGSADGFWIRRRNFFFGRAIHGAGWGRDRVLRFLRRGAGHYPERAVHEEIALEPGRPVGRCRHRLAHHSYTSWEGTFERMLSYSTRGALVLREGGRRVGAVQLAVSPLRRFLGQYLLRAGFRDGVHGFVLCALSAGGLFLRLAKLRLGELDCPAIGSGQSGEIRVETVQGRFPRHAGTPGQPEDADAQADDLR